jgi:predicted metalloprotease with PDZ domain
MHARSAAAAFAFALQLLFAPVGPARAAPAPNARPAAAPLRMSLDVDLRESPRRIFHARLRIPARPGPLVLVYPKWIPGEHAPTGPIRDVAGFTVRASGKPLAFRRDDLDMYKVSVEVPAGADAVEVTLDLLSPPPAVRGFSQGASATSSLVLLSWNQVVVVPEGAAARDVTVDASLRLPPGWGSGTALETAGKDGDILRFKPVSLEQLIDSPVTAGAHFREVQIGPKAIPHFLEMTAETDAELELRPEQKSALDKLVAEALALYGSHHYGSYRFLFTQSDSVAHFGLEHHQSSDDRVEARTLLDRDLFLLHASLLPHEFTHSWNGKYRRPAGLATPDYQQPMKGELLWVYEGLTQHLGQVLTARSGLTTLVQARDSYAITADAMVNTKGRAWRDLQDTATAAQLLYEARGDWGWWRRSVDFYPEGDLIWLEVDAIIRETTAGAKSLDDFCKLFLGGPSGSPAVETYDFGDVVATLARVAPYDWAALLEARLHGREGAPLAGLARTGWKLGYSAEPSDTQVSIERATKSIHLAASIGIDVDAEKGAIHDVVPGSPADKAGIAPEMKIIAVGGRRFTPDLLRDAVAGTKGGRKLELLIENADSFRTYVIDYQGGARYPHLVRDESKPDLLTAILRPLTGPVQGTPATQATPAGTKESAPPRTPAPEPSPATPREQKR